jgi:hypothetical protein
MGIGIKSHPLETQNPASTWTLRLKRDGCFKGMAALYFQQFLGDLHRVERGAFQQLVA